MGKKTFALKTASILLDVLRYVVVAVFTPKVLSSFTPEHQLQEDENPQKKLSLYETSCFHLSKTEMS